MPEMKNLIWFNKVNLIFKVFPLNIKLSCWSLRYTDQLSCFIFFLNDSFIIIRTTKKKTNTKRSSFKMIGSLKSLFFKTVVLETMVFIKLTVLLTILNNNLLLTIFNKERNREETALKGISTNHWAVLKKILRNF